MATIQEISLQSVPNQSLTVNINNQTLNIAINTISVNNKPLQNQTPSYEPVDTVIGGELVPASSLFTMCNLQVSNTPIISNVYCNNAEYINQFPSGMVGYLFFYRDDWETNDQIIYTNFGQGTTTHLYYADYDALAATFNAYVQNNKQLLVQKYLYGFK